MKLKLVPRALRPRKLHPLTWKRRWKVLVLDLLGREESPERVAAAIALGIGIGFSPFIGLHIWLALGLAFLLRLNKIDAALGQFAGNPWTLPPVYAIGYRLGRTILGYHRKAAPKLNWEPLLQTDLSGFFHPIETVRSVFGGYVLMPRVFSFLVGTTILALLFALVAYLLAVSLLRLYHSRHPGVARRAERRRAAASRSRPRQTRSARLSRD